ncbi:c-type cytochrome [Chitinophaga niabensis]|uniref:Cytochrome C oxidase, cbb3-type, subunit III n=1 Tax=Chitinophaga niabensis TaxID=536979 RepID=A0A1N6D6U4_9BACT|nr:cytochrome c [Chitinophaga niabensis]SIN66485.1 Cytochrome C oxidase, cbb3-type, subunit III [Chitinophaga niabensis]
MRYTLLALPLLAVMVLSNKTPITGDTLYKKNCKVCHGNDGARGFMGAKNLKLSNMETSAIIQQIREGKSPMPSFKKKFSEEELAVLADYVKSLRQN